MRKSLVLVLLGGAIAGSTLLLKFPLVANRQLPTASNKSLTDRYIANGSRQKVSQTENDPTFKRITEEAVKKNLHGQPMGEIVQAIALRLLNAPYKAGLLDSSPKETLLVTFKGFDCMTFVETVLALARSVAVQDYSYQTFVDRVREQRYRDGLLNGYCSRLHYFSEWIADNQKHGKVKNITRDLGGVALKKPLNFMSKHKSKYARLATDLTNYKCIVKMEKNLAKSTFDYLPESKIRRAYPQMQPGDIVAIATNINGLDVTHTGLVYRSPNGNIGLIHASPIGKVTIASDLQNYVRNIKNASGILVARPRDPRQTTPQD